MRPDDTDERKTTFWLEVQPETPLKPWHATLCLENANPLEFDSPLELARYLANLSVQPQVMNTTSRRGLR